jgi:EmrB/QacA subfamily drug resistance transporter
MSNAPERRRWWILLAMTGSLSMIMIDTSIVAVALPPIQEDLSIGQNLLEWVVIAYILVLASLMALGGRLGDLLGKPNAFIGGTIGFGIASLLCGLAWDGPSLIAARILQGLAAVVMQPASSALVIGAFPPGERGKAMGIYAGIPILFLTVGPVLGGLITEYASWRLCFIINLPIALAVATAAVIIKPTDTRAAVKSFDWRGASLLATGLPALVLSIQQGQNWGWDNPITLVLLLAGILILVTFVIVELRVEHPIVHLELFRDRAFLGDALMLLLVQAAITGIMIFIGIYLQVVLGYSPGQAGAAMMPLMVPVLVMVHFAGRLYDRIGVRSPATIGAVLLTIGLAILAWGTGSRQYPMMAFGMFLIGMGVPFVQVPSNTDGMSRIEAERRGMASGVLQTFRQFGAATGLAILAAVIATAQNRGFARSSFAGSDQADLNRDILADAARGNLQALNELRTNAPEVASELVEITRSGIAAGVWTATAIAATIIVIAPLMLSTTTGKKP